MEKRCHRANGSHLEIISTVDHVAEFATFQFVPVFYVDTSSKNRALSHFKLEVSHACLYIGRQGAAFRRKTAWLLRERRARRG